MELDQFFDAVITPPAPVSGADEAAGWFCLAIGKSGGTDWFEHWYRWPTQRAEIVTKIASVRGEHNVYFSPHLFQSATSRKANNVVQTHTITADLDEADVAHLPLRPTILVSTSPKRHQAYWVLKDDVPLELLETLSRKLTYAIAKCDHSGWPLGHKFRVPDTFNFKYMDGPKPIEIIEAAYTKYESTDLEQLPEIPASAEAVDVEEFLTSTDMITAEYLGVKGPQELLTSLTGKVAGRVIVQYSNIANTGEARSGALWALMCQSFAKGGLTREQVFFLAKHSANNKFADLRHNADRELAKDVLRAEATVRSVGTDPKSLILSLKMSGAPAIRKPEILKQVMSFMQERGAFMHSTNDTLWYVRRDLGRPIVVSERSDYLNSQLDLEYGLNVTEADSNYTVHGLCAYVRSLPMTGIQTSLSYYDKDLNVMLLHTGRRDVLRITPSRIDTIIDGSNGVIFPWQSTTEPFTLKTPPDGFDWGEVLFGLSANGDALSNLINLSRAEAIALLKVWLLFLLFRNAAISRPLLATFGQPGSGKSTLFRKLYVLLYGRQKSVGSVTTPEDFDHAVAYDPFVVLDNVDSPERWLPDRLALSASTSDIVKRKLYTDADSVVLKRQALVGITAHNPRFGREDVADRLLLLTFERLNHFIPEQIIVEQIMKHRAELWGGIVADLQKIISTPIPAPSVQFRVEDFAWLGTWIADAIDCRDDLSAALESVKFGQHAFSLEEDAMLVTALRNVLDHGPIESMTPSQLWGQLERRAADPLAFVKIYRNSKELNKKLLALQDALKQALYVEWSQDATLATKFWTIREKPEIHRNGTNNHVN